MINFIFFCLIEAKWRKNNLKNLNNAFTIFYLFFIKFTPFSTSYLFPLF